MKKFLKSKGFINIVIAILSIMVCCINGHSLGLRDIFFYDMIACYGFKEGKPMGYSAEYEEKNTVISEAELLKKQEEAELDLESLSDLSVLRKQFYIVDKKTGMSEDLFNVKSFLSTSLKIKNEGNLPKVLIFHTHSREMFKDSITSDINEGIVGAGERLKEVLEKRYGIKCLHHMGSYDVVSGKVNILGAYERMEPAIRKVIKENPSIEVAIDLHRDGVAETTHLVKNINGKPTAQLMFFNGLCRGFENGKLTNIKGLENPYLMTNLAFSFNMELAAKKLYPGFSRKIYLNAYRYSLHMLPKSLLVELGAQNNTKEEIYNSVDLLAEILAEVIL